MEDGGKRKALRKRANGCRALKKRRSRVLGLVVYSSGGRSWKESEAGEQNDGLMSSFQRSARTHGILDGGGSARRARAGGSPGLAGRENPQKKRGGAKKMAETRLVSEVLALLVAPWKSGSRSS